MKTAIALAALLFVVCAQADINPAYMKKMETYIEKCSEKNGVKKEDVMKMFIEKTIPESQDMKCVVDCYFTEAGYMKDGKMDWEAKRTVNAEKHSDPESVKKANEVLDVCKEKVNIDGKKECERGVEVLRCMIPEGKKIGMNYKIEFSKAA